MSKFQCIPAMMPAYIHLDVHARLHGLEKGTLFTLYLLAHSALLLGISIAVDILLESNTVGKKGVDQYEYAQAHVPHCPIPYLHAFLQAPDAACPKLSTNTSYKKEI
jgi:hypothetical protein